MRNVKLLKLPPALDKVTASFVLQHTVSEIAYNMGNNPTDDLLMTMWYFEQQFPIDQRRQIEENFMRDLYKTLEFHKKCTETSMEILVRYTPLGRALSMQGALGYQRDKSTRWSMTSKVAFTLQSLRLIAITLAFAPGKSGPSPQGGPPDFDMNKPGELPSR